MIGGTGKTGSVKRVHTFILVHSRSAPQRADAFLYGLGRI